ncbi:peptidase domain-containing ABC transporter [Legionella brunensis]|uniref:ABC transporter n=1 Tax=Legionella brunensis TaxID=29422 RepID=A0A0W0STF3_9GAMM|nr:peptidase domain-containing ABC transporter [Legionella brunensis]KTC86663.1 ABC transporter [Legionella brunensis]
MMELSLKLSRSEKNKLPVIRQDQISECGHACVVMISNFYGHDIDLFSLRELDTPSLNGGTMLDLVKLLERLKLKSRALRVDIEELGKVRCPAILHWDMNHFVVLKYVGHNYVVIHDPATGRRKILMSELSSSFTGIALEVEKNDEFKNIHLCNRLKLVNLFKNVKGIKSSLLTLLLLSLAIEVFILLNPLFLQYVTDNIATTTNLNNLYVIATGVIILTVFHAFTEYVRSNFVIYLTNSLSEYFSSGVMSHLLKLPLEYFERRHKGDILSRFHSVNEIQSKITTDSINTVLDGLVIVLALIIMSVYSWFLTLIVTSAFTIYLLLRAISYNHLKNQTEISIGEHANVNSKFLEIIQSIMPVKIFAKEETMYRSWKNYFIKAVNADIKISQANIVYNVSNILLFNFEHVLVICIGATLVITNQFSVGMLVAFLAYRQTLVNKATSFIHKIFEYKLITIQINRIADILTQPLPPEDPNIVKEHIQGDIKVENVTYKYPGNSKPIFDKISVHIRQAEKVVITGSSGIGKTTLLKIMLGLIPPTEGKILVDDVSLDALGQRRYREICSSVMQDDSLISGSILDNITFMDAKIDIERVYEAAKIAQIHNDILSMTMGYETLVGDMGSSLSGGQKQRILIARALYKKPKILFLDEATSHLDIAKEIKINAALKELQITQIVIAHRQETINMADRIIDLSNQAYP